jgi:antitoxin (DNA-binding transcriptional repressor) of toxin-antitoxin stability system
MYKTREMQTKAKEILDAVDAGEEVQITRNGRVYRVVLAEGEPVRAEPRDDLLATLVEQGSQQIDLLRQLVEHKDTVLDDLVKQTKAQPAEVATSGIVTARVDEEHEPATEPQERPTVVIPERVEDPKPEPPGEPTQGELRTAHEYFGLRETTGGLDITEKGIQSALSTVKKIARQDPESAEAKVMVMGAADEDRIEFLRCVQIDKLTKALAKRAAGDPKWLGMATPPRF